MYCTVLYCKIKNVFFFVCFLCGYYLCEKYCKPITVQYHIDTCVSWIPRLTLLDLGIILDYECILGIELICIQGTYCSKTWHGGR